ncbi:MAG TPA: ABC transporter ATP-binding protein [Bacillota bacterium]|jgi:ABC-2 type transport system ATP-binding protein|nr:ABC transporter ATP-binding protein [Bacillota bacterium]
MIKVQNVDKSFDGFRALQSLDLNVRKGSIYGLVGTNGAGKTTLIKHVTGILKQDGGSITIEDASVYENLEIKRRTGYIPDDLYFFASYNLKESARFYRSIYPGWNEERYAQMAKRFELSEKRKLSKFSKGMQKQAAFILTMSSMPDYLILDEPIDGLDPIIRKLVWKYVVEDVAEREMTVLVSSHNLREMEGICDSIGILSKGKMMIERDLDELKSDIHKIQVAFREQSQNPYEGLNVLHKESRGTVDLLIVRNRKEIVEEVIAKNHPVIFDLLPLSLEEIFIYELGGGDSEIEGIIF